MQAVTDEIDMVKGEGKTENNSRFIAYAAGVKHENDIQAAYLKVKTEFASASYVVCAHRLLKTDHSQQILEDYADDWKASQNVSSLVILKTTFDTYTLTALGSGCNIANLEEVQNKVV